MTSSSNDTTLVSATISPTVSTIPSQTRHAFAIKLKPHNYLAWKTQFFPLLNYQNLMSFVDGSRPAAPKEIPSPTNATITIPNPEFLDWFTKDQMLMTWLLSSLSEEVYSYVIGLTSSLDVWQALGKAFGSISLNRQLQLHID